MPRIGVVIVSYNNFDETITCVRMYQMMKLISSVVVVFNAATEGIKKEVDNLTDIDKCVFLFEDENLGYSKGNNIGIDYLINEEDSDYIIISNSDVWVEEKTINECIAKLCENNLGVVAPYMKDPNGNIIPLRSLEFGYMRLLLRIVISERFMDRVTQHRCEKQNGIVLQSFLPGSFLVFKRQALEDIKGFDDKVFLYREEEILGERLKKKGYRGAVVENCYFIHNHNYSAETAEEKIKRNKLVMQSEIIFFKEYLHAGTIQMIWVRLLQFVYGLSRTIAWKIIDKKIDYGKR